jgi:dipeptidyl aminopeptidase/acylaminoacyl peptidase
MKKQLIAGLSVVLIVLTCSISTLHAQKQFTFEDVMKFEELRQPVVSANGTWIAYGVWPERGDGEVRVQQVSGNRIHTIARGERPQLSRNGDFAAAIVQPPFLVQENASRNDRPRTSLALLNTRTGDQTSFDEVQRFAFAANGQTLIIHHHQPKSLDAAAKKNEHLGRPITLVALPSGETKTIGFVNESAIDSTGRYFVYAVSDTLTSNNGLYSIDLQGGLSDANAVLTHDLAHISNLSWDDSRLRLAFTATILDTADAFRPSDAHIATWAVNGGSAVDTLVGPAHVSSEFRLRAENRLVWTRDGARLFYAVRSAEMVELEENKSKRDSLTAENMFNLDYILEDIRGDVWHWNDPLIKTHEKMTWNRRKGHLFTAVYHLEAARSVQLATHDMPEIDINHNAKWVLGSNNLPYQQLITWDGNYSDVYKVNISTGERELFLEKSQFGATLSPNGRFIAYFDDAHWHLHDVSAGRTHNLTQNLPVPFENEDNDLPRAPWGYGIAGWVGNDDAVIIRDKYDNWQFDTATRVATNLTNGRPEQRVFRILDLAENRVTFAPNEEILYTMYHDYNKNDGFYRGRIGAAGVTRLLEDEAKLTFVAQAQDAGGIVFTNQRYDRFPNLWYANDNSFRRVRQVTRLHENLNRTWKWGKAELVSWLNVDGREVQGVLIYPGDYERGKRYPVMVYYYERFSQRLHEFNHPYTNHRPNYAQYTSDGYAVFLPDVWFDVPLPGYSATKNLVPGVQKLVEMGVADPKAIGLHGHSWSGYLSAHVITQTNIFAAAVAGAPVSNMTSAYSGIRWGSGLARQFQYEQAQSRLGVSMYENHQPYIENSPVFYANRINTPLLIQFGDKDDAVPWEQGIELYLAMRRLGKDAVFLQYHNELHHLRHFPNRLDYAMKMKEYFDHYLKGAPAPAWMTDGVPYLGD